MNGISTPPLYKYVDGQHEPTSLSQKLAKSSSGVSASGILAGGPAPHPSPDPRVCGLMGPPLCVSH